MYLLEIVSHLKIDNCAILRQNVVKKNKYRKYLLMNENIFIMNENITFNP